MIPFVAEIMNCLDSIGERLREVREAMGLSQSAFAEIAASAGTAGTTRQSQSLYEKGKRLPDAAYLAAIAAKGADVLYILTGQRDPDVLRDDERRLVTAFRAAPAAVKEAVIGALGAWSREMDEGRKSS